MVGIEYVVALAQAPKLFLIHKRHRHSPRDWEILSVYYVLEGSIYMAPDLLALLSGRMTASLAYLGEAVGMGEKWLRYEPDEKAYKIVGKEDVKEVGHGEDYQVAMAFLSTLDQQ